MARDNYNEVVEGPIWSFTTGNDAPASATDPLPIDGGSIVHENAYLSWSSPGDPNPDDTVTYDLYFGTSVSPPLVQSDYSNSSYDLGALDPGTTYYWKIVTRDNHGAITEGQVWTFTALDHAPIILNNVTYSSDTTLTKNDGPYIVQGNFSIDEGVTITTEPGTIFKLEDNATLNVNGTLIVQGSPGNEIIFTSYKDDRYGGDTNGDGNLTTPSPGDWNYIIFRNGSSDSILQHVKILYAGSSNSALYIYNSSPTIQECTIQYSMHDGIYITGAESAPLISGNEISYNDRYGIYAYSGSPSPIINSNTFRGNVDYDIYYGGSTTGEITGNRIENGIYVTSNEIAAFSDNTIAYNNDHPLRVHADDVSELFSSNTISNLNTDSYLEVSGGTITRDATWPSNIQYHILGNITVQGIDGADEITTLTIEPGAELRFNQNVRLNIGSTSGEPGALSAVGTADEPIIFTCNQETPAPGDWYGIYLYDNNTDDDDASTILEHCVVEYAGTKSLRCFSMPLCCRKTAL